MINNADDCFSMANQWAKTNFQMNHWTCSSCYLLTKLNRAKANHSSSFYSNLLVLRFERFGTGESKSAWLSGSVSFTYFNSNWYRLMRKWIKVDIRFIRASKNNSAPSSGKVIKAVIEVELVFISQAVQNCLTRIKPKRNWLLEVSTLEKSIIINRDNKATLRNSGLV